MSLPVPHTKNKEKFIQNCMSSDVMKKEFPENNRRLAVCFSQWRRKSKNKQSKGSTEEISWEETEKELNQEKVWFLD